MHLIIMLVTRGISDQAFRSPAFSTTLRAQNLAPEHTCDGGQGNAGRYFQAIVSNAG